jgi:DNA-binding MarR family transcriptional regulator
MRQLDRDLHPFGLSMHDYEILVELSEAPRSRMRMTELADRTAQSRSRLSHQINRMETRGLVTREGLRGRQARHVRGPHPARRGNDQQGRPASRGQRPRALH